MGVIKRILPSLGDDNDRRGGRGGGGGNEEGPFELRVLIHQSRSGAVIGKGGTRIKDLRTVSN